MFLPDSFCLHRWSCVLHPAGSPRPGTSIQGAAEESVLFLPARSLRGQTAVKAQISAGVFYSQIIKRPIKKGEKKRAVKKKRGRQLRRRRCLCSFLSAASGGGLNDLPALYARQRGREVELWGPIKARQDRGLLRSPQSHSFN